MVSIVFCVNYHSLSEIAEKDITNIVVKIGAGFELAGCNSCVEFLYLSDEIIVSASRNISTFV